MKDYYQILGVEEEASGEKIEARWVELMKQYRSRLNEREGEAAEKIKEIREAYEVLREPSSRREYDFGRFLRRSIVEGRHQRRKKRYNRKKRLVIPAGIVLLILIGGLFIIKIALTPQQKPVVPVASAPVPEVERVTSTSKPVPGETSKAPDHKSSQKTPDQIVKSQEALSPVAKLPKKELEPREKVVKETHEIEKPIFKEMPKPISKERPKVVEAEPVSTERPAARAHVPVSEGAKKPEVEIMVEKEKPKATPGEVPKEVSRALPKGEPKTIPQESPVPQPSRPLESKPTDQKSQAPQVPSAKPSAPTTVTPSIPRPFVEEDEVREFLAKYVDRYTQRDIEGFLSFFSPMALQNQKDRIEKIREMYSKQFERYERFKYQLKDPKMKVLQNSVKVRASYEIEQFSKKGETKQLQGEIEWELVREGKELKVLTIEYRPEKTK